MIRPCTNADFDTIYSIINGAADAYRGVIPADRWQEPYMPKDELRHEIESGVKFWGFEQDGQLLGVMGIQDVQDVTLIRHAYVRTAHRSHGIGGRLLAQLQANANQPILIGTWAAATWAIRFYENHGFRQVTPEEKDRLLKKYWSIPERQVETSVVLAEEKWFSEMAQQVLQRHMKMGRKVFSKGVWTAAANVERIRAELEAERSHPSYAKRKAADAQRREKAQAEYVEDFLGAVLAFLRFHPSHHDVGDRLARAVTDHATPVGSGTVARTKRIPVEQRADAAVIAWMRHQTTGYDDMVIQRVKGKRREVRRMLSQRSHELLGKYRRGEAIGDDCPLRVAMSHATSQCAVGQ